MLFFILSFFFVASHQTPLERDQKVFNVLNVVQFPNDACTTSTGTTGVCYTSIECGELGGTDLGSCANGFGSCCYFSTKECGGSISLNNTVWSQDGTTETSPCTLDVCKMQSNICQIRLDFETFDLDQPSSSVIDKASTTYSGTQCQKSQLQVLSDGYNSPAICGSNTGYHMIVEAFSDADSCNKIEFRWTGSSSLRSFDIRISQYACDSTWKAPAGCTQWYTGTSGSVYSYNWQGGVHLANQRYDACVRREEGYCSIAWWAKDTEFQLTSSDPTTGVVGIDCTTDYVMIPRLGPSIASGRNYDRFCGGLLSVASPTSASSTGYTRTYPFKVGVYFNGQETTSSGSAAELSKGFRLRYEQGINCS